MRGIMCRAAHTWAITLMSQMRCQPSSGASAPPPMPMPALEQKRSIGPWSVSTLSIIALMSASFATFVWNATPPISSATARAPSPFTSEQTTSLAPSSPAKRRASARPMPLAAPVTTTIRSLTCMPFLRRCWRSRLCRGARRRWTALVQTLGKFNPFELAARGARQRLHEVDVHAREAGERRLHGRRQRFGGDRAPALDEEVQLFLLRPPGSREHANALAAQGLLDRVLPRLGGVLVAADMHDVGGTPVEREAALAVENAEVAGIEPAVREEGRRRFRVADVAVDAALLQIHADAAEFARRERISGVVHHLDRASWVEAIPAQILVGLDQRPRPGARLGGREVDEDARRQPAARLARQGRRQRARDDHQLRLRQIGEGP